MLRRTLVLQQFYSAFLISRKGAKTQSCFPGGFAPLREKNSFNRRSVYQIEISRSANPDQDHTHCDQ